MSRVTNMGCWPIPGRVQYRLLNTEIRGHDVASIGPHTHYTNLFPTDQSRPTTILYTETARMRRVGYHAQCSYCSQSWLSHFIPQLACEALQRSRSTETFRAYPTYLRPGRTNSCTSPESLLEFNSHTHKHFLTTRFFPSPLNLNAS